MVVLLNNETAQSEWCRYEWDVAAELGLPVKVLVDLERLSGSTKQEFWRLREYASQLVCEDVSHWFQMIEVTRQSDLTVYTLGGLVPVRPASLYAVSAISLASLLPYVYLLQRGG